VRQKVCFQLPLLRSHHPTRTGRSITKHGRQNLRQQQCAAAAGHPEALLLLLSPSAAVQ
jgi:hypothetical protein